MPTGVYKRQVGVFKHKFYARKHGMCNYPEYTGWLAMRDRCKNPNNKKYGYYGGRGITVCKEWNSFKTFIENMGRRPVGGSLDRINVNGNYCKENCRWATKIQQANNTRDNRKVDYNGRKYGIRELSELTGISQKLLNKRIFERGWDVSRAVINKSFIGRNQYSHE